MFALLAAAAALLMAQPAAAVTYAVTSTQCDGPGSIRDAMTNANNNPGEDTIEIDAGLQIQTVNCSFAGNEIAPDYFAVHATESVIIEGNGAKLFGIINWVDSGGVVTPSPGERCIRDTDLIAATSPGFILVGERGADNSDITVTVRNLDLKELNSVAYIEKNASLVMEDLDVFKIIPVWRTDDGGLPAVTAVEGANFTARGTSWGSIFNCSRPPEPQASSIYNGAAFTAGSGGDLTLENSFFQNIGGAGTIFWNGRPGSKVNIVSSRFDSSGGFSVFGDATTNIVNTIWSTTNLPDITDTMYNVSSAEMNIVASTILWPFNNCDADCNAGDKKGMIYRWPAFAKINLRQSAIGLGFPDVLDDRKMLDPSSADPNPGFSADAYTFVQPVPPAQDADALRLVTDQPSLITGSPALGTGTAVDTQATWATPVFPGVLIDVVDDAVCDDAIPANDGVNALRNPIDGTCITEDALGNPRVDGNGKRNSGAVQLTEAPHLAVAGAGSETVDLSWSKPGDLVGLCGYRVTYREKGTTNDMTMDILDPDTLSYQVTGLTNGIEYEFEVEGLVDCPNPAPSGVPSNLVTATPQSPYACAILADRRVEIGGGALIASDVCSNGNLGTGAKTAVGGSVLGLGNLNLGIGTGINLDAIGNGNLTTDGKVNIGLGDGPDDLDVDVGGDLKLGWKTRVEGECRYVGSISTEFWAECGSETFGVDPPLANPFALPVCAVTSPPRGAPNLHKRWYSTTDLTPGDYGHAYFGFRSTVTLAAGEYHFQSLSFGAGTRIEILGPVDLHVVDTLNFGVGAHQVLTNVQPNEIVYRVGGKWGRGVHSGGNTVLYGTFCTPSSTIALGIGSELWGGAIGKDVKFGSNVFFLADPAPVQ
jgi:hypothetical protein